MSGSGSPDTVLQIWYLAWTADTFPHLGKLLLATGQNYPYGLNFGVNGSIVLLGLLFAPITKLFGPVVAWNMAIRLSVVVSASAMCLALRRWTTWWPAAFVGGLMYGFSPYQTHLPNYLFLIFVPLPPLFFVLLHELLVRQRWSPVRTGVMLGLVCVLQFFISTEILAGTVLMGAIAVIIWFLANRRSLAERWRYASTAVGTAIGLAAALLLYPIAYTLTGPQHIQGPPDAGLTPWLQPDVTGSVFPVGQLLGGGPIKGVNQVIAAISAQMYIGIPLLVLLCCLVVFLRKNRILLFAAAMACISFVFSLGHHLSIGGRQTGITLPFAVLLHLPFLNGLQASRLGLYTAMFISGIVAVGLDEAWKQTRHSPGPRVPIRKLRRPPESWRLAMAPGVTSLIAILAIVPWIPQGTNVSVSTDVAPFFSSHALYQIPAGSVVLAYPYPDQDAAAVLWAKWGQSVLLDQAVAGMRFNLIGGYGWFPALGSRVGTTEPAPHYPRAIGALFDVAYNGGTPMEQQILSAVSPPTLDADLRIFLHRYHVGTVLCLSVGKADRVTGALTSVIGRPVRLGGVTLWLHVKSRLASIPTTVVGGT